MDKNIVVSFMGNFRRKVSFQSLQYAKKTSPISNPQPLTVIIDKDFCECKKGYPEPWIIRHGFCCFQERVEFQTSFHAKTAWAIQEGLLPGRIFQLYQLRCI